VEGGGRGQRRKAHTLRVNTTNLSKQLVHRSELFRSGKDSVPTDACFWKKKTDARTRDFFAACPAGTPLTPLRSLRTTSNDADVLISQRGFGESAAISERYTRVSSFLLPLFRRAERDDRVGLGATCRKIES